MYLILFLILFLSELTLVYSEELFFDTKEFKSKTYQGKVKQIEDTFDLSENSNLLLKSAEEYFSLVEGKNDNNKLAYAYHRLGVAHWRLSAFQKAFDLLEKANEEGHKNRDTFVIIESWIYQGIIYNTYNWYDKSIDIFHKSLHYAKLAKRYHDMASCCWNLSNSFGLAKNLDSGSYYVDLSFKYLKMMEDQTSKKAIFAYSLVNMHKGVFYLDQSLWDSSLIYYRIAFDLSKQINSDILISPLVNCIMDAFNYLGKYDSVINLGRREMPIIKLTNNFAYLENFYFDMSYAFAGLGKMDSAYHYLMEYKVANDSMVKNDARVTASLHEIENLKADNEIKRLSQNNIIYSAISALILLLGVTIFIYYRYRIKSKINKQQEELNRTKDRLFSLISHDLRTPLHSLNDLIKLIDQNYDDFEQEQRKKYINTLLSSSTKVTQLLENLLYWSRMQLKGISSNPEEVNLRDLIIDEVNNQTESFLKKKIKISINCDNINVFVDVEMMRVIIRNLLSNAIKFTYENGNIILIVEQKELIILKVIDDGIGIKDEDKEKLFKFGTNFSSPGTSNEKGTGLGLILIKELAEKNNIQLSFNSKYGEGTEFILKLAKQF